MLIKDGQYHYELFRNEHLNGISVSSYRIYRGDITICSTMREENAKLICQALNSYQQNSTLTKTQAPQ